MITFDYAQLNKKGLKDVVKWFEKQALPVAEVRGNNVPKRENGFQVKQAEIEFESGQVLVVKAKANVPAFFQVKLNGKVLAIRDYKQLDNELREIANFVKENEPKYSKNQEKASARAKVKVDVPKPVVTTTTEQVDAYKASLAELQGQSEALGNQLTEITAQVNMKAGQLADLQGLLASEKGITDDLESQLEKAKQGVFESAPVGSQQGPRDGSGPGCDDDDDPDDITESATKRDVVLLRDFMFHKKGSKGYVDSKGMLFIGGEAAINTDKDKSFEGSLYEFITESAVKCENCGAPMSSTARRCMSCGKTPEQAHMLAGKKNQEVE